MAGGPCTGLVPLAFLEITHVTVDEVQHLVPSFEVALQVQMACGCTLSHVRMPLTRSANRWLNRDKLTHTTAGVAPPPPAAHRVGGQGPDCHPLSRPA